MPIAWCAYLEQLRQNPPPTAPKVRALAPVQTPFQAMYKGKPLTFSGRTVERDVPDKILILKDGAKATYGPTTVTTDRLEIHLADAEQYFVAQGKVIVADPDGTIKAEQLHLSWLPDHQFAHADHVVLKIAGATIKADHADLTEKRWILKDYFATTDRASKPLFSVSGKQAVIEPGHDAELRDSQLNILDQRIFGFHLHDFNLNPQSTGLRLPNVEYRGSEGFGYNWTSGNLLAPNLALEYHSDAAQGNVPGYGVQLTKSFIPAEKDVAPITPRSEFSQRFSFGYMEDILTDKPSDEVSYLAQPKKAISAQTIFNAGVSGRGVDNEDFSVPMAIAFEQGGKLGDSQYISQLRIETIDSYRKPYVTRAEELNSFEVPVLKLGPHLFNMARIDTGIYQSDNNFLWARGTESLIYQPNKALTLGAAGFVGFNSGTPDFDIDPLDYKNGFALRADYKLGPRKISVMARYDTRLKWFDDEYFLTQAMGPLEAFIVYRKYPGDSHFGVLLRVDQFQDLLTRRNWSRHKQVDPSGLP